MRGLWVLLPDELLPLVVVGVGLALMLGLVRTRAAFGLIAGILLVIILTPFISPALDWLPSWLLLLLGCWLALYLFRSFFALLIGPRATDEMVGEIAADVVRAVFRGAFWLAALPFRIAAWMLRRV